MEPRKLFSPSILPEIFETKAKVLVVLVEQHNVDAIGKHVEKLAQIFKQYAKVLENTCVQVRKISIIWPKSVKQMELERQFWQPAENEQNKRANGHSVGVLAGFLYLAQLFHFLVATHT